MTELKVQLAQKRDEEGEGIRVIRRREKEEEQEEEVEEEGRIRGNMDPAWMRHHFYFFQGSWIEAMFHLETLSSSQEHVL